MLKDKLKEWEQEMPEGLQATSNASFPSRARERSG